MRQHKPSSAAERAALSSAALKHYTVPQEIPALEISGETEPCSNMDRQWPGLTAALTPNWRGGVTARVLTPGHVAIGDAVRLA